MTGEKIQVENRVRLLQKGCWGSVEVSIKKITL